jgi:Zn-dependent protease with chaperone function
MAAFGITGAGIKELFSSHPPLDDRIAALEKAA